MDWDSINKIKFYKFYFKGVEKPIIIESYSLNEAENMLSKLSEKSKTIIDKNLIEDIRIEMPIKGISKRKRHGNEFIWVGTKTTTDGWMLESEFKKLTNDKN
jgi:hypothetical protein